MDQEDKKWDLENDPALKAQMTAGYSRSGGRYGATLWTPPKWNPEQLIPATLEYYSSIASAWVGRPVRVITDSQITNAESGEIREKGTFVPIIKISKKLAQPESAKDLAHGAAMVVHEVGHLISSPKTTSMLGVQAINENVFHILNMIEDPREELLSIQRTPGFEKYLRIAAVKALLTLPQEQMFMGYLILAGRTYMSKRLRQKLRELSVDQFGESAIAEFESLLSEYMAMDDPTEHCDRVMEILRRLREMFPLETFNRKKPQPEYPGDVPGPITCCFEGNDYNTTKSGQQGPKVNLGAEMKDNESDTSPEEKGGQPEVEAIGATREKPDWDAPAPTEAPDHSKLTTDIKKTLAAIEEALEKQVVSDELTESYEVIRSEAYGDGRIRRPSTLENERREDMTTHLRRLMEKAKGGVERSRPRGRLNVRRYLRKKQDPKVEKIAFDQYRPNAEDALNMEVVFALDNSGSMYSVINEVAGIIWALTTAFEALPGASVTVVVWNTNYRVFKVPSQKWSLKYVNTVPSTGGTWPEDMLNFTKKVFENSKKDHRIQFILTDGEWSDTQGAARTIRSTDADTYILGVNGFNPSAAANYGAISAVNGGINEIADFIFQIAQGRMAAAISR